MSTFISNTLADLSIESILDDERPAPLSFYLLPENAKYGIWRKASKTSREDLALQRQFLFFFLVYIDFLFLKQSMVSRGLEWEGNELLARITDVEHRIIIGIEL